MPTLDSRGILSSFLLEPSHLNSARPSLWQTPPCSNTTPFLPPQHKSPTRQSPSNAPSYLTLSKMLALNCILYGTCATYHSLLAILLVLFITVVATTMFIQDLSMIQRSIDGGIPLAEACRGRLRLAGIRFMVLLFAGVVLGPMLLVKNIGAGRERFTLF